MVSKANILENVWDVIRTLLAADGTVTANSTGIHGSYIQKYIDKEGGLPFVVIHKPEITEETLTFSKKRYMISIDIECFANKAANLKTLSDAIRSALEGNRATFRTTDLMFNFKITSDTEDFDPRGNKRVHIGRMTCEFEFLGGG